MADFIRIQPQFADRFLRFAVIAPVDRIREKKLGLAVGSVALYGKDDGRADQYAVIFLFGDDDAALLNSEPFPQLRRNNDGPALADLGCFHLPDYMNCLI